MDPLFLSVAPPSATNSLLTLVNASTKVLEAKIEPVPKYFTMCHT
jgi:hypothetical protein